MSKRLWLAVAAGTGLSFAISATAQQQPPNTNSATPVGVGFNERVVEKRTTPEDRDSNVWMLSFHFKDPRLVKVNVPGKGLKNVWYMWYQVSNETGEARAFHPRFVWVCHDENTVHADQVLHSAQKEIQKIEDPQSIFSIKNSWTIGKEPIPLSKEFNDQGERIAFPLRVTGVATWDDVTPASSQFSVFVYGLSNGYTKTEGEDGKEIVRVKTLQLKFRRQGDSNNPTSEQIRFVGYDWMYATTDKPLPIPAKVNK